MENINSYAYLLIMSLTSVSVLFIISKLLGKKQIAQLEFIDYVMGISIGSIAAEMATDTGDKPIEFYIIAMVVFFLFDIAVSFLGRKSPFLKHFLKGRPITIIYDGEIDYAALKRSKLDVNDVIGLCREQGYFDISLIAFAVFENSGNLSVMPIGGSTPLTLDNLKCAVDSINDAQKNEKNDSKDNNAFFSNDKANVTDKDKTDILHNDKNKVLNYDKHVCNNDKTNNTKCENAVAGGLSVVSKLPFYMVVDGRISFSSLTELGKDTAWLFGKLNVSTADMPSDEKLARCSKLSCMPIKQLSNIILAIYDRDADEMKITYKKP